MAVSLTFRTPRFDDAERMSALVRAEFDRRVAGDWSEAACSTFREEAGPCRLMRVIEDAFFCEICIVDDDVAGMVAFPSPDLLALSFVAAEHCRQGIGSALIEHGIREIEARAPELSLVSLNATRYAVPFYASLGFHALSPEFIHAGAVATRMALWLPYYQALRGRDPIPDRTFNPVR
jgi:GNAT superfamily N-acetyltransferase